MRQIRINKRQKVLIENFCLLLFTIGLFSSSYDGNFTLSLFSFAMLFVTILMNKNYLFTIALGVSMFATYFILYNPLFNMTMNVIVTLLVYFFVLLNIKRVRVRVREWDLVLSIMILVIVPLVSILKLEYINNILLTYYMNILVFILISIAPAKLIDLKSINKGLYIFSIICIILSFVIIVIAPYQGNINLERFSITQNVNYNRLGMAMVLYCICVLHFFIESNSRIKKLLNIIVYILGVYVIIRTGSRNSFIALIISSTILVIKIFLTKRRFVNRLQIVLILGVLIISITSLSQYLDVFGRLSLGSIVSDGGSGRLDSIMTNLKISIPSNLFFGVGLGGQEHFFRNIGEGSLPASHNIIISTLVELGLFGFFSLWYIITKTIYSSMKNRNKLPTVRLQLILLISLLLLGIGETIFSERILWIILGLLFNVSIYNINRLGVKK